MNAFRFRLQKVLDWRRSQLEAEEIRYKRQAAALADIDRARQAMADAGERAETDVRALGRLSGADLEALDTFRRYVKKRGLEIAAQRADCAKKLAAQETVMMEARRRYRLLERLKERRWAEWWAASDKELEELAAESYAAQWTRKGPGSSL